MKTVIKKIALYFYMVTLALPVFGQTVSGTIFDIDAHGNKNPVPGVNVLWLGTSIGESTNQKGEFKLSSAGITNKKLVVSFIGYKTDTIDASLPMPLSIILSPSETRLTTVVINGKRESSYISQMDPRQVQIINKGELFKAACCNLSESFETNASVDVMYSDAVTGAKQIQLLGLPGIYSQIITENVPLVRGLASSFGLGYIPGSWMESIQVSKGASSVINGFESTTGQINVEFKKPATSEQLFVNLFGNSNSRFEANANGSYKLNSKLSTMGFVNASIFNNPIDRNGDNFLDIPRLKSYNLFNRWDYMVPQKYVSRFGIKYMEETRTGGTLDFNPDSFVNDNNGIADATKSYGIHMHTRRLEGFWKNGFLFKDKPYKSVALILSGISHRQEGYFGLNTYNASQQSFNANLLYQSIIGNTNHKFTTGLSLAYDDYKEEYNKRNFTYLYQVTGPDKDANPDTLYTLYNFYDNRFNLDRKEIVPGAFMEYTWSITENIILISGLRIDNHNKYGTFLTPRVHFRWKITPSTSFRASAGKGHRSANVFAENYGILASQRHINFVEDLRQENAWNFGLNLTHDFKLFSRNAQFDAEVYRTDFISQVIIDLDRMPEQVYIYNLNGKSFSNIAQVQLSFKPLEGFDVLAAFRLNDVKQTINGELQKKPFTSAFKGLLSLSYATKWEKWKFDLSTQLNGKARIPDTHMMPAFLQRPDFSPVYIQLLGQVTRKFKYFDVYLGGENLTNYTQKDPISDPAHPYHNFFDTGMVWGPIVGATVYAGLRYTIK